MEINIFKTGSLVWRFEIDGRFEWGSSQAQKADLGSDFALVKRERVNI